MEVHDALRVPLVRVRRGLDQAEIETGEDGQKGKNSQYPAAVSFFPGFRHVRKSYSATYSP